MLRGQTEDPPLFPIPMTDFGVLEVVIEPSSFLTGVAARSNCFNLQVYHKSPRPIVHRGRRSGRESRHGHWTDGAEANRGWAARG